MRLVVALVLSFAMHLGLLFLSFGEGGASSSPDRTLRSHLRASLITPPVTEAVPDRSCAESSLSTASADAPAVLPSGVRKSVEPPPEVPAGDYGAVLYLGKLYYFPEVLTRRPKAISVGEIETPEVLALKANGRIVLKIWVDETGKVANLVVENGGLPNAFADAASRAFVDARFEPGEREGKPVGSLIRIEVAFGEDSPARPFRRLPNDVPPPVLK